MGAELFDPDEVLPPSDGASRLEWALFCASIGLRVHPLYHVRDDGICSCGNADPDHKSGKHPLKAGWQTLATRDEPTLRRWWKEHPRANVGISTGEGSGVCVIDADGLVGRASLTTMGLPETFTVETGGGGLHLYFKHPELGGIFVGNKCSKLAPKVDVRTERGNLVGPGSANKDGRYRIAKLMPIAELPPHIIEKMLALLETDDGKHLEPRPSLQLVHDETIPLATRERRARAYARAMDPAISGSGGHTATFEAAARIARGFDLPDYVAYQVLADEFNPRCKPPWSQHELRRKIYEAMTKSRFEWGHLLRDREQWNSEAKSATRMVTSEASPCTTEVIPPTPSPAERVRSLIKLGPVLRLDTGLPTIDRACRGGLPNRRLVVFGGAPGAGKTTLATYLGWRWSKMGVPVAFLSVDEGPEGVLMRIAQMEGLRADKVEERDPEVLERLAMLVGETPLDLVDDNDFDGTVEGAASLLMKKPTDGPRVLIVDSIQTIRALGSAEADSPRERVDAVVKALKRARDQHGLLVIATCELARGAYRSRSVAENINDLAAFKESGGIEYAAQTALVLRSVPDEHSLTDVTMPKNRAYKREPFRLHMDGATTLFREIECPVGIPAAAAREERADREARKAVEILREIVVSEPGIGEVALRAAFSIKKGGGVPKLEMAKRVLGTSLERRSMGRNKVGYFIRIDTNATQHVDVSDSVETGDD